MSDSKYPPRPTRPLSALGLGAAGVVVEVIDHRAGLGDDARSTLARRLVEIGFVAGERCEVISETWPTRDPMAVRIGNSTFALRRREAEAVQVHVESVDTRFDEAP